MSQPTTELPRDAVMELRRGKMIQAVAKLIESTGRPARGASSQDLRNAKDLIERYLLEHPETHAVFLAQHRGRHSRTLVMWLLVLIVVLGSLVFWLWNSTS